MWKIWEIFNQNCPISASDKARIFNGSSLKSSDSVLLNCFTGFAALLTKESKKFSLKWIHKHDHIHDITRFIPEFCSPSNYQVDACDRIHRISTAWTFIIFLSKPQVERSINPASINNISDKQSLITSQPVISCLWWISRVFRPSFRFSTSSHRSNPNALETQTKVTKTQFK